MYGLLLLTQQANVEADRLRNQAVFHFLRFNKLFTSARPNVNDESVACLSVCGRPNPLRQDPVQIVAVRQRWASAGFIAVRAH